MSEIAPNAVVLTVDSTTIHGPNDFAAQVVITNNDSVAIEVNTWTMEVPTLALEVQDGKGRNVPHLPPPVPDEVAIEQSWQPIDPGTGLNLRYSGLSVDREFMPAGKYRVRFNGTCRLQAANPPVTRELTSDWVAIEVTK